VGYDHDRAEHVFRSWPLRELLRSYTAAARDAALESYRFECLKVVILRSAGANVEAPPMPGILKEVPRRE